MPLAPGTRLGPYEIVSPLGQGGMGEVYRARDTRLGRDVAVKVLHEHRSAQPEVRARFEREARTVSSLNHPNICALYDVGREGDVDYLVLELVDGETLEQRLARGRVPTAEALRLGAQIADALDRAHRAGVVHRDLKPSNVMLTRAGAKLMDFGLARVAAGTPNDLASTFTKSPTMARPITAEGTLLGTFQYMAPEQLEGRETDARSDIWALGCVLYELFAGRRAFEGRSKASLIAAILEREPPPVGEPPSGAPPASASRIVPPQGIERLIRNCLAKDPEERIQTAHDVKLQLRGIAEGASMELTGVPRAAAARSTRVAWGVAAFAVVAALAAVALLWPAAHRTPPVLRFTLPPVDNMSEVMWPRVSPDGRFLVVRMADSTGTTMAGVRRMDQVEVHEIPGTRGLQRPYWSPDGREVAFVANGKLQRVALAGGSPIVICDAPFGSDLSWGAKGKILVDGRVNDSLVVVPAGGGALEPATRVDRARGEVGSSWPSFLPDGERFLFIGTDPSGNGGTIRLGRLGSLDAKILGHSDGRVEWAPGDWVLFVQGSLLMAQKLDLGAGKLVGPPIQVTDQLRIGSSAGHFSVSSNGILAFARDPGGTIKLQAMSRAGVLSPNALATGPITSPAVSPDGRRVLYERVASSIFSRGEIYVLDLERKTDTRLTFTGNLASCPLWSPDGRRIAYEAEGPGGPTIRLASADGLGGQDSIRTPSTVGIIGISDWAPGRILAYGRRRVWQVPIEGTTRNVAPLLDPTLFIIEGRVSPDGRWLTATSGVPPAYNAFVYGLGDNPGRWQLSGGKTYRPRWTKGGREIVFESTDRQLWAVDVDTKDGFRAGAPRRLFALPMTSPGTNAVSWDCDASGETFYVTVPVNETERGSIEIVSDFRSLVSRR